MTQFWFHGYPVHISNQVFMEVMLPELYWHVHCWWNSSLICIFLLRYFKYLLEFYMKPRWKRRSLCLFLNLRTPLPWCIHHLSILLQSYYFLLPVNAPSTHLPSPKWEWGNMMNVSGSQSAEPNQNPTHSIIVHSHMWKNNHSQYIAFAPPLSDLTAHWLLCSCADQWRSILNISSAHSASRRRLWRMSYTQHSWIYSTYG